jgi:hypothetical protein
MPAHLADGCGARRCAGLTCAAPRPRAQVIFCNYVVSLCVYPGITAWLRPARSRGGSADGGAAAAADALFPFGLRLRGDLLVPLTFVVFNAVRLRAPAAPARRDTPRVRCGGDAMHQAL